MIDPFRDGLTSTGDRRSGLERSRPLHDGASGSAGVHAESCPPRPGTSMTINNRLGQEPGEPPSSA